MDISINCFPEEAGIISRIADHFRLGLDRTDDNDVLLLGMDFAIDIAVDREGVRLWYFDARFAPELRRYALDYLIYRKRYRSSPQSFQFTTNKAFPEVISACKNLKRKEQDGTYYKFVWE